MKFKCCEALLHSMNFQPRSLMACGYDYFTNYYGEVFSIDEYKKARDKITDILKRGDYPEFCKTCGVLAEREWDESVGLTSIEITNRYKCTVCNCIYCIATDGEEEKRRYYRELEPYDIKPIILNLRNNNIFLPDCTFAINGGEVAEYPEQELKYLIYMAVKQKSPLSILSSGIKFSKPIYDALALTPTTVKISVDAGTPKTYEKIKRVKGEFNRVWANLGKYIKAARKYNMKNHLDCYYGNRVVIKYIIIPGINDNLDEAKAFINKCEKINCQNVEISLEMHWKRNNYDKKATGHFKDTIEYFYSCNKDRFYLSFAPEAYEYLHSQIG